MSIPPLVCSTPPPPDQCVEDKDPEDFDLSYNLSQEDDDETNDYDYGNFSSYNHFQSSIEKKTVEIKNQEIKPTQDEIHKEVFIPYGSIDATEQDIESNVVFGVNDINENKLKCEEDVNIEDLDLKVDEEIVITTEELSEENDTNEISEQNVDSLKDFNIPSDSSNGSQGYDNTNTPSCVETSNNHISIENKVNFDLDGSFKAPINLKASETPHDDTQNIHETDGQILEHINDLAIKEEASQTIQELKHEETLNDGNIKLDENVIDDDFGDFDEFQSVDIENSTKSGVENCDNPWENANTNESDFGNFTANFEETTFQNEIVTHLEPNPVSSSLQLESKTLEHTNIIENDDEEGDDDFGDFDDFKSSATVKSEPIVISEEDACQELHVLNLQATDNEHQIMESITKVISSVFLEEISEPDSEFEGKLETLLSETWGHLMEIDERQPYIVNWNNSLGQKTLLRALCIDSRNILFGPKWSSHMPKYAVNLSNAPLQPQKQASTPSTTPQIETVAEKPSIKPTTWTDPFTSDGQDSCNTESSTSTGTSGPTDVDVFEAAISNKPDKIYSNTLGVQPLRHINLPDTHIFTPTDSEIPRSKTIHYDSGSSSLLTQSGVNTKNHDTSAPRDDVVANNPEDDNEYWEFQDFKGTPGSSSLPGILNPPQVTSQGKVESSIVVDALPQPSIAYQTQLLQPIKVEPAMPALNWPDPGEVKGVFDDFSEFVATTSQPTEKQDIGTIEPNEPPIDIKDIVKSNNLNDLDEKLEEVSIKMEKPVSDGFDDEFDTFQSAMPTSSATSNSKTNTLPTKGGQFYSNQAITDFNYVSSKVNSIKSDTISSPLSKPTEALTQNIGYMTNSTELANKTSISSGSHSQSNMLQPTIASFSSTNTQNQQKSGQILQPLSLESYSQINWPSPGIDLQDLSRFNPVETLQSLKSDLSASGVSKTASPVHGHKSIGSNQMSDDDVWGDFVSSKPKQQSIAKKQPVNVDDDEWTDFISSPSVKPQNGLNTISLNVYTNSNIQKSQNKTKKGNQTIDIPTLNYITPKSNSHKSYNDKHFQNL